MANKKTSNRNRWISTILAMLGSVVVLVVLFMKIDIRWEEVRDQWRRIHLPMLGLAIGVSLFWHVVLGADKWYRILKRLGARVTWWEVFSVRLGSDPVRFAAPFKSGEIVNAAYLYQKGYLDFPRACSSIAFDKVLNFLATIFWLMVGMATISFAHISWKPEMMSKLGVMLLVGAGCMGLLVFEPFRLLLARVAGRIHPKLGRLFDGGLAPFREMTVRQKCFFLLYGVFFLLRPLILLYLLFVSFGVQPSINEVIAFGSVAVLMSNVPLTQAGIGPREAAIVWLFSHYVNQEAMLVSIGLLMSFAIHIAPALLGIPLAPRVLRASAAAAAGRITGVATGSAEMDGTEAVALSGAPAAGRAGGGSAAS